MNLFSVNPKLGILSTIAIGTILTTTLYSAAIAEPAQNYRDRQFNQQRMHEYMKARLDKLANRLEIKASQEAAWEDFAKSVETLADRVAKKPGDDADAATISRYRADRAAEFAAKLNKIADATAKLQSALSDDQRKVLNQSARRFLRQDRGMQHGRHEMDRDGNARGRGEHEYGAS